MESLEFWAPKALASLWKNFEGTTRSRNTRVIFEILILIRLAFFASFLIVKDWEFRVLFRHTSAHTACIILATIGVAKRTNNATTQYLLQLLMIDQTMFGEYSTIMDKNRLCQECLISQRFIEVIPSTYILAHNGILVDHQHKIQTNIHAVGQAITVMKSRIY